MADSRALKRLIAVAATVATALLVILMLMGTLATGANAAPPASAAAAEDANGDGPGDPPDPYVGAASSSCGSGHSSVTTTPPSYLTRTATSTHFRVHYTTDSTNYPSDALNSTSQVSLLAQDLEDAWTAYGSYGFLDPDLNSDGYVEVYVYDYGSGWGATKASWDCFLLKPSRVRTSSSATRLGSPHHELFHRVQYKYDSEASWLMEGTPKFMEDKVFDDTDQDTSSAYIDRVNGYLADPDMGLKNASYNAALFWAYFVEQYGSTPTSEPGYRSNAMVKLWEAAVSADGQDAVADALTALGASTHFAELFADFALANYTKDYTYTAKFAYVDDDATSYDSVDIEHGTQSLSASSPVSFSGETLTEWGIDYFEATPSATNCPFVTVTGDGNSGDELIYHIVTVKSGSVTNRHTTHAEDFTRTFYNGSGNIDRVALIAGATQHAVTYDVTLECTTPALNIQSPTGSAYAYAGDPANPDNILVMVEVTAGGTSVKGLERGAFVVDIGGKTANLLSSAYVQDQYWLLSLPPTQTTSTWYDLTVTLAGVISATENNAVLYLPRPNIDEVLVVDVSGSMSSEGKLDAAKNAARLYVDVSATDDQIGVVTYSTVSKLEMALTTITGTVKTTAKSTINGLSPQLATCIGCGVQTAQNELSANGDVTHWWNIVLLSDGMENVSPKWDDVKSSVINTQTVVHTVFLGPADADGEELMQRIADEGNNGTYNRVYLTSEGISAPASGALSPAGVSAAAPISLSLPNRMADIYGALREAGTGFERFYYDAGYVTRTNDPVTRTIGVEPGMPEAVFAVNWPSGNLIVTLKRPNGTVVSPGDADLIRRDVDATHIDFVIRNPMPGLWTIILTRGPNTEAVEYLIFANGNGEVNMEAYLGLKREDRITGRPMPILVTLVDRNVITGANIIAVMQGPSPNITEVVRLFDDGNHGDGGPNDGIYGGLLRRTRLQGSYRVLIRAAGRANPGYPFTRLQTLFFFMKADQDTDKDGLPNEWEKRYGFDINVDNADADPDQDGLTNIEELKNGTNPLAPDTDRGGERDGSEVKRGGNPLDPDDDRIRPPGHIRVIPGNGHNVILFDRVPSATRHVLYRAITTALSVLGVPGQVAASNFVSVNTNVPTTGIYTDVTAANDTTYIYKLTSVDAQGNESGYTAQSSGTPRVDPDPPDGRIVINGDAVSTTQRLVTVNFLGVTSDTVSMTLSSDPAFPNTSWQAYISSTMWNLPSPQPGYAMVYAKLRDGAGNVSQVIMDGIQFEPQAANNRLYLPYIRR